MPRKRKRAYNQHRCMAVICARTATTDKALIEIVREKSYLPNQDAVYEWLRNDSELAKMYAQAKEEQLDYIAFDTMRIAEEIDNPNKARNMIDARKWLTSKLNPHKYGDRLELNGTLDVRERDAQGLESGLAIAALLVQIRDRAIADGTITPKQITLEDKPAM